MLEHLGESDAAERIHKAVTEQSNAMSDHLGTPCPRRAVGDAIAERL